MQEIFGNNNKKLVTTMGGIVKKYRLLTGKSIYTISAECGLSKATWREVEIAACNDIKFTTLWKIADGLEVPIDVYPNQTTHR